MRKIILIIFLLSNITFAVAQESIPRFDVDNIRVLHHVPYSEHHTALSQDNRYIVATGTTVRQVTECCPELEAPIYEEVYLKVWDTGEFYSLTENRKYMKDFRFNLPKITKRIYQTQRQDSYGFGIGELKISPDNQLISLILGGQLQLFDLETLELVQTFETFAYDWSEDGEYLGYLENNVLKLWNTQTKQIEYQTSISTDEPLIEIMFFDDTWLMWNRNYDEIFYSDFVICDFEIDSCKQTNATYDIDYGYEVLMFDSQQNLSFVDLRELNMSTVGKEFNFLDLSCASQNYRYICTSVPRYSIWSFDAQKYLREFGRTALISFLPSNQYFAVIDSFIAGSNSNLELYNVTGEDSIQQIKFSEALASDWQLINNYTDSSVEPNYRDAEILVSSDGNFLVINLAVTIVYVPITYGD